MLTDGEGAIYTALSTPRRRLEFLGGRVLAKICVKGIIQTSSVRVHDIDIGHTESGAPNLSIGGGPVDSVNLSISHGGDYLLAAAAKGRGVGVDVEEIGSKAASLKEPFASQKERHLLEARAGDAEEIARAYTTLFSAKEAAAKCLGTHMYNAFYYLRLVEMGRERLVLKNLADKGMGLIRVEICVYDGHVFSFVEGCDR